MRIHTTHLDGYLRTHSFLLLCALMFSQMGCSHPRATLEVSGTPSAQGGIRDGLTMVMGQPVTLAVEMGRVAIISTNPFPGFVVRRPMPGSQAIRQYATDGALLGQSDASLPDGLLAIPYFGGPLALMAVTPGAVGGAVKGIVLGVSKKALNEADKQLRVPTGHQDLLRERLAQLITFTNIWNLLINYT